MLSRSPPDTWLAGHAFYNADMAGDLKGYDGAVGGVHIIHGVAIMGEQMSYPPQRQAGTTASPHSQPPSDAGFEAVIQRAIEVIGDREEAMRWLGTPVRALGYATPISRLHDSASQEQVLAILTQLEHGVL